MRLLAHRGLETAGARRRSSGGHRGPRVDGGGGARPGDKDPQAAWGLDAADREKKQVSRVLRPPNPLKLGPECWGGWSGGEDRTLLGLGGTCRRRCRGAHRGVASLLPAREAVATPPKPSRKLRGSLSLSTVQPAAGRDHRTPPAAQMGRGTGSRQWVGREFPLSSDSRAGNPTPRQRGGLR